jgi:hypothetical protein
LVIGSTLTAIGLVLTFFLYIHGKFDKINDKFDNVNKEISSECKEIREKISNESKEIRKDISLLSQRLSTVENGIENFKIFIPKYKTKTKPNNPHPDKFTLLDKLYDGTINYEDAIFLQNILEEEKLDVETSDDTLKLILLVGILAYLILVISRLKRP